MVDPIQLQNNDKDQFVHSERYNPSTISQCPPRSGPTRRIIPDAFNLSRFHLTLSGVSLAATAI